MVSFIIPTYNRPELITKTLDSLLKNTDERWEAVCIDDGSEEETLNILETYSTKHENIKFIQRISLPKGAPHCRNIGVENANGKYLIFLDSDDMVAPWCVADQLETVRKFPNYDIWAFSLLTFKNKPGDSDLLWEMDFIDCPNNLDKILLKINPWSGSALLWRKEIFDSMGGWNNKIACWQDWELDLRIILNGFKMRENYDQRPQLFIRRNNTSQIVNDNNLQETILSRKNLFSHAYKLLQDNNLLNKHRIEALSGYVFKDALKIIDNNLSISYVEIYNTINNFNISRTTFYRGLIFLKWRKFTKKNNLNFKITRFVWPFIVPSRFSGRRKYKLQKVNAKYLNQVKQLNY